eukprot:2444900-Rhodomonas_salina.1
MRDRDFAHEFSLLPAKGAAPSAWIYSRTCAKIKEGKLFAPGPYARSPYLQYHTLPIFLHLASTIVWYAKLTKNSAVLGNLRGTQDNEGYGKLVSYWMTNKYTLRYTEYRQYWLTHKYTAVLAHELVHAPIHRSKSRLVKVRGMSGQSARSRRESCQSMHGHVWSKARGSSCGQRHKVTQGEWSKARRASGQKHEVTHTSHSLCTLCCTRCARTGHGALRVRSAPLYTTKSTKKTSSWGDGAGREPAADQTAGRVPYLPT